MFIEGFIKIGTRTKELVKYISNEDIAIIQHDDIDELAAEALISAKPKAIINTGKSMSGCYFSRGTSILVNSSISLFDSSLSFNTFKDNDFIRIKGKDLILNDKCMFSNSCLPVDLDYIRQKSLECRFNQNSKLNSFIDNTLHYATKEKDSILNYDKYPEISTSLNGRTAIVVVRSSESCEALLSLKSFINAKRPVIIAVDGAADTVIRCGFSPDILIGDMDSVSDVGIFRSSEVILHAYSDGRCPCLSRISQLNIRYKLLAMPGTSEDIAVLLAYDKGASNIILIGGHNCMTDFLERGRQGMGSTLLTRLKAEDRLVDYSHIMKLQSLVDVNMNYTNSEGDLMWMKL